jgi:hypothetical protein
VLMVLFQPDGVAGLWQSLRARLARRDREAVAARAPKVA